jgi:hypothetical protein
VAEDFAADMELTHGPLAADPADCINFFWSVNNRHDHDEIVEYLESSRIDTLEGFQELFVQLVTNTSLREVRVTSHYRRCYDDVMSALARFLAGSSREDSSLVIIDMRFFNLHVSQAAFASLCDGIAESAVLNVTPGGADVEEANLETTAESLARAISESSLEEVTILGTSLPLALRRTTCVRDLDFAFSHIGNDTRRIRINRKWKPLLSANTPAGLWHRILAKAHTSPEMSHGPVGILFYLLREKADLVPAAG